MKRARVLTAWTGNGSEASPYRSTLAGSHALVSCVDVTGQPAGNIIPSPNLHTVEIVCGDAEMAQIAADPAYSVIWSEPA